MTDDSTGNTPPKTRLTIGWAEVEDLSSLSSHRSLGAADDRSDVVVRADALRIPGAAYIGDAVLEVSPLGSWHRLFTGLVERVEIVDGDAYVLLVGSQRELQEQTVGGLLIGEGTSASEVIYGVLRASGWPEERIKIESWKPGPTEVFLVATPIEGGQLAGSSTVSGVTLSSTNPAILRVTTANPLVASFTGATAWASVAVDAETIFHAEVAGLERIEVGLSVLRALGAYSYPVLRDEVRGFERERARARVRRVGPVFTGSLTTDRRWLREPADPSNWPTLSIDEIAPDFFEVSDNKLARAVREWRAAADAADDFARVSHMWRAVECYASRAEVETLFAKPELKKIRQSVLAVDEWSEDQKKRIGENLPQLNSPPLLARLRMALEQDGIDFVDGEFETLKESRPLRNALEHGLELNELQHRILDRALAFVNRIIVTAAASALP